MTRQEPDFVLDEQLCFALYSASKAVINAYRSALSHIGLTYTQYLVMLLLWEHGTLPMTQLCERLHLDSATLSPLLKRLAAQRLVTRERSLVDERLVEISCTPAGRALRKSARHIQGEVVRATGLSPHELARMRADLHRLTADLREPAATSDATT